jgi:hypothetical protein
VNQVSAKVAVQSEDARIGERFWVSGMLFSVFLLKDFTQNFPMALTEVFPIALNAAKERLHAFVDGSSLGQLLSHPFLDPLDGRASFTPRRD